MTREERIRAALIRIAAGETYRTVSADTGFSLNMLHHRFARSGLKRPAPRLRAAPKTVTAAQMVISEGISVRKAAAATGAQFGNVWLAAQKLKRGKATV